MSLLTIDNVSKSFGGVQATRAVSLRLENNELLGLIGPNGAGKTTLLRLISGTLQPDEGRVFLNGEDVTALPTHRRARMGMIMTHQTVRPFRAMTLQENVAVAVPSALFAHPLRALFQRPDQSAQQRALELLERVGIAAAADQNANEVPLGFLKRLQIARALAAAPNLLLLDEPLAGLNHNEAARMADLIRQLNSEGLSIVLIEHNLGEVLRISRRLAVLDNGGLLAEGDPKATMHRPDVRAAYLGISTQVNTQL